MLRLCANVSSTSGRVAIRPADRTSPASEIATSQKSRCTSKPIALTVSPFVDSNDVSGELWANDTDGYALVAQPGQSQGRPPKSSGSTAPSTFDGLPTLRSPDGPESSYRTVSPAPDGAVNVQFHPPRSSSP